MDMEGFLQKLRRQKFQAPIKLAHPFPAPELRTKIIRTRGFSWDDLPASLVTGKASGGSSRKFGGLRAEVSRRGPRLLRSCLGVEISRRNPSEANF